MKLAFVFIENYKSINKKQKLVVNEKITTIIGKNESGKSNIIEFLSTVDFANGVNAQEFSKPFRASGKAHSSLVLEFELSKEDISLLQLKKQNNKLKFELTSENSKHLVSGREIYTDYFTSLEFKESLGKISDYVNGILMKIPDKNIRSSFQDSLTVLNDISGYLIPDYVKHFRNIEKLKKHSSGDEEFEKALSNLELYIKRFYDLLPIFHKVSNTELKSNYLMNQEFFDKLQQQDQSIQNLIKASNCPPAIWRDACYQNRVNGIGIDAKANIKRSLEQIQKGFTKFYTQEEIEFNFDFDASIFSIHASKHNDMNIGISERSNGLKWYFSLYVDMIANNLVDRNVIFLLDEPGVFLHVLAQKELLRLFEDLTTDKHQIIYTTHSPFMIYESKTERVVPIQKTSLSETLIFNSIFSDKIEKISKYETLTPLLESIGMNLSHNIGFDVNKVHVITEGLSDAIYLNAIIKHLRLDSIKIIPSKSATNVLNMSLLLYGLGYKFKALFDYDKSGIECKGKFVEYYTRGLSESDISEFERTNVFYVSDCLVVKDSSKTYTIESLLEPSDLRKLANDDSVDIKLSDKRKILIAQTFSNLLQNKPAELSTISVENFSRLIRLLCP